jgi:glycosyltransferase involved in cell wall biosynthesis
MITHDQFDKKYPNADLIRFKCLGESLMKHSIEVVYIASNVRRQFEEDSYKGSKIYKIPFVTKAQMVQVLCFNFFLLLILLRISRHGRFQIIFVNSILTVPCAWVFKWISGNGCLQFDLMGILSEEKFIRRQGNFCRGIAKRVLSYIEDFLLSRVDFITTINDQHRQILLKRIRRPVYVIRDGVHEELLRRTFNLQKEEKDTTRIVMIFVGQLNHSRLDLLFRTMPDVIADLPSLYLQILGSGPQLDHYRKIADTMRLKENIRFEGYISHERIFDYIANSDIAYSDDWSINGFPMKLFEYLAMGKPVIAEETDSIKELLIDNKNALLYKNENTLKEKIFILAQDEKLRRRIGKNGRRMIKDHIWEERGKELHSIYRKHIEAKGIV